MRALIGAICAWITAILVYAHDGFWWAALSFITWPIWWAYWIVQYLRVGALPWK